MRCQHPWLRSGTRTVALSAPLILALGCWGDETPTQQEPAAEASFQHGPVPPTAVWTFDDEMAATADRLPGFAGLYLDSSSRLVVRLTDPARFEEAPGPVEDLLRRVVYRGPDLESVRGELLAGMRVEPADYDFRELLTWYRSWLVPEVLGRPGVTLGDIDEVRNRIVIGVRDPDTREAIAAVVEGLPVPTEAVAVEVVPPTVVHLPSSSSLNSVVRPVLGGVALNVCTLGFNVSRVLTNGQEDGQRYFVTNSHCTATFGQVDSVVRSQPNPNFPIGFEVADPPLFTQSEDPACPPGRQCRYSDAALFQYFDTVPSLHAEVAWPEGGGSQNHPHPFSTYHWVMGSGDPPVGETVHKVGKSTGRTWGQVQQSCVDVPQFTTVFGQPFDTGRTMLCQGQAGLDSEDGDSGAPVVRYLWGTQIVERGILWGGNEHVSSFSLGARFRQELQAETGGALHTTSWPIPQIVGPTFVPPGVMCLYTVSMTGGTSPLTYEWSGLASGTGSSVSVWVQSSGWLHHEVTDAGYRSYPDMIYITVDSNVPTPPECAE